MQSMKRGVLALAATLATAVTSGVALAAPAGPLPYPRCQPVCKGGPTHGPRVEAIFVHAHNGSQPLLVVDAYLAGFRHEPYGELCYEHTQPPAWVPGCVVHASARGRLTRKHTWHVHFRGSVDDRR